MLFEKLAEDIEFRVKPQEGYNFCLHNIALDPHSSEASLFLRQDSKQILIAQLSRSAGGVRSMNFSLDFDNCDSLVLFSKGGSVHIIGGYKKQKVLDASGQNLSTPPYRTANNEAQAGARTRGNSQFKQKINMPESQTQQQQPRPETQPLRRSTRARAPAKPVQTVSSAKAAKREKQELKNMAKYFDCNLEEDEDDSFEEEAEEQDEQQSESEELDEEEQEVGKKGRKMKVQKDKQIENEMMEDTNSQPQSQHKKLKDQLTQDSNFSVPTRNPYV